MRITIRERGLQDNRNSLYLDFYPSIYNPQTGKNTRREFLRLYVYKKPRNEEERHHNKETRLLAQKIRAKRQLQIQEENYGFFKKKNTQKNLLPLLEKAAYDYKKKGEGSPNCWLSVYTHLCNFTNDTLVQNDITVHFCKKFKQYLQECTPIKPNGGILATNTSALYFAVFKTMVRTLYEDGHIESNVAKDISNIKKRETKREFLSYEELKNLSSTPCSSEILKRAALFSALTGLRYSDIEKLTWQEVYHEGDGKCSIRLVQKKTKEVLIIPISKNAVQLLGDREEAKEKVFKGLLYSRSQTLKIEKWVNDAGIDRKITFHCFRHTFATLQLTLGTNIMTIKELLGHRNIQTTMVYAKVVNSSKQEAADKMNLF